jgi:RNA polymerase sigma-70 factor (ECF subfamily)
MMQTDVAEADMGIRSIDAEDFDWIVPQHQKQIYRVLLFLVRSPDVAETLTQECFMRAFRKRGTFRGEANPATWLVRIAINLARDHNRNRRWAFWRRLEQADGFEAARVPAAERSAEQAAMDNESLSAIQTAVGKLPERQKTAFMLRFVEDMPLEAIAEVMNLELGTVKSHLFRALGSVRSLCMKRTAPDRTGPASLEWSDARTTRRK